MKKLNAYQWAYLIALLLVVIFYVFDYYYLHLLQVTRFCIGVLILFVFVITTIIFKARRDESSRVSTAKRLGNVISHDDQSLSFVRNKTTFSWESALGGHKITFQLPINQEKFSIRHQSWTPVPADLLLLAQIMPSQRPKESAENLFSDCQPVQKSGLPGDIILQSKNTEFLQLLLNNDNVKTDLKKYLYDKFKIAFDGSLFEMNWETGSNEELEDFRQICHTAIIFRDEMETLLKR